MNPDAFWGLPANFDWLAEVALNPETGTSQPTTEPTAAPSPVPTAAPTDQPTDPVLPPTAPPSPEPTPVPTAAPSPSPTESPTKLPTESPTMSPTMSPMKSVSLEKYICSKNDPGDSEICSTGTVVGDGECTTDLASCGNNGRKTCYLASCPSTPPGPTNPPTPPPSSPPAPTPPTNCPVCENGDLCCPGEGICSTSGKPITRGCNPI